MTALVVSGGFDESLKRSGLMPKYLLPGTIVPALNVDCVFKLTW